MSLEEIKQWVIINRKPLAIGAAAALLIRAMLK